MRVKVRIYKRGCKTIHMKIKNKELFDIFHVDLTRPTEKSKLRSRYIKPFLRTC